MLKSVRVDITNSVVQMDFQTSHHVVAMEKVSEQCILTKCSIYAEVFKLQVILPNMELKSQKVATTHQVTGIDSQVVHHVLAMEKEPVEHILTK